MVGATVGLDDLLKAQAEERSEDWAGRSIKGVRHAYLEAHPRSVVLVDGSIIKY
jgi:hypothetical protein